MMIPHIEGDSLLIKHNNSDKVNGHLKIRPKTIIFAGNGSVTNGNIPLCDALKEYFHQEIDSAIAASLCSIVAHEFKAKKLFTLKDPAEIIENVGSIDEYMSYYYNFKKALADRFCAADHADSIALRDSNVVSAYLSQENPHDVGIVTTNWDRTFWKSDRFQNVIQLHGVCDQPDSIVLPSEFATDEELAEIMDALGFTIDDEGLRIQIMRMFRGDYMRPVQAALQTANFWLNDAECVIIWGLALHPYDAEVCHLLRGIQRWNSKSLKRVIVINPDESAGLLAQVLIGRSGYTFEWHKG